VLHHEQEQLEFFWCQMNLTAFDRHLMSFGINLEIPNVNNALVTRSS
jgi:hypothetical protein